MNKIELMLITEKILTKLFGENNVIKVVHNSKDGNKINYCVQVDGKKFYGCVFHSVKLTVKDVRNILFAYKRNVIKSLKEVSHVDSATKEVCSGVHQ